MIPITKFDVTFVLGLLALMIPTWLVAIIVLISLGAAMRWRRTLRATRGVRREPPEYLSA